MELRQYQIEAKRSAYRYLRANPTKNPCICMPTGSGKSLVIADVFRDAWSHGRRALLVTHVRELLVQ